MCKKAWAVVLTLFLAATLSLIGCSTPNSNRNTKGVLTSVSAFPDLSEDDQQRIFHEMKGMVDRWLKGEYQWVLSNTASICSLHASSKNAAKLTTMMMLQDRYRRSSEIKNLRSGISPSEVHFKRVSVGFARWILVFTLHPDVLDRLSTEMKSNANRVGSWEQELLKRMAFFEFKLNGKRFMHAYYKEDNGQWKLLHGPLELTEREIRSSEQRSKELEPPSK